MNARIILGDLRFIASVGLVGLTLLGGAVGQAALILLLVPTIWIVTSGRPQWLPLLYLIHLPTAAFGEQTDNELGVPLWSIDRILNIDIFAQVPKDLIVGGVQLNVALFACGVGFVRALMFTRPWPRVRQAFALLSGALAFATVSAVLAQQEGLNGWSQSIRYVLTVGAFFWGTTLVRRSVENEQVFDVALMLLAQIATFLLAAGLLRGHLVLLSCGIVAAFIPVFAKRRMWFWMLLAIAGCAISYAQGTLTMRGIMLSSFAFTMLTLRPIEAFARFGVRALGFAIAMLSVLTFVVVMTTADASDADEVFEVEPGSRGELVVRARDKLLLDRAPIWRGAWEQVISPPYIFVPAARPLRVASGRFTRAWTGGAHNVSLEAIRNIGIPGGLLLLIAGMICYAGLLKALTVLGSEVVRAICSASAATIAIGFATGNFPLQDTTGVLIWSLAGMTFAAAAIHSAVGRTAKQSRPMTEDVACASAS